MKFEYQGGALPFLLDGIEYLNITRDAGFETAFSKGKRKHALFLTASGEMRYSFFGCHDALSAPEGTLVYIPPKLPYISRYTAPHTNVRLLLFDIAQGALPPHFRQPFSLCSTAAARQLLIRSDELTGSTFLAARAYGALSALEAPPAHSLPVQTKLEPALQELRIHFRDNRKIAFYAGLCHMSESNFRKLFREAFGKSPIAYRNSLRLAQARMLIESGECTVEEAAATVGFQNMSFFYQSCKREFGTTHLKK